KAKTPEEFFAAMDAIAKKSKPEKKASAYPSRIQAMANFFGSSGGSGGAGRAPSLSAPNSKELVQTPHAAGPGALPRVERDRDFRAAYGDSGQAGKKGGPLSADGRSSALSGKPEASSPMAGGSTQNPAAGPGGTPRSQGPSDGMPEAEGEGKKGVPTPPKTLEGKPVDSAKKSDAAAADSKKAGAAQPSLGTAAAGQYGSGNTNPSDEEIRTGVSSQGLAKDARSGGSLGSGLLEATQNAYLSAGGLKESPRYGADSLLAGKADDRSKVAATKAYNPDGVKRAFKAGQEAPKPPDRVPETADDLVKGATIRIGGTDEAQRLVVKAREDFNKAVAEASQYQLALQKGGKTLEENNKETTTLSDDLVKSQKNLQAGARDLESLKPKLNSLGQSWQAAATPQEKEPIVLQAASLIQNYSTQAQTLSAESRRIENQAQPLIEKTARARDENRTSLVNASDKMQKSLAALDASIRNLATQVASAGAGEGDKTQLSIMRNNGVAIVQRLTAGQQKLQTLKLGYDKLARGELLAGKALDKAVRGLKAE
ncbi:MAG: hypothetical protein WC728_18825, partial [Elusimicrobiota bacterium]